MVFSKHLLVLIRVGILLTLPLWVRAHDRSGFISIDCGLSGVSRYTDETTGITYVSDEDFVESGENGEVSQSFQNQTDEKQLRNLRSFPEGNRNCYTLKPAGGKGNKYLIRARFMYGNYDSEDGQAPTFDLYLGVELWDRVNTSSYRSKELIHVLSSDHIHVCLVNIGNGTPFISVLELRPLKNDVYVSENGSSLDLHGRYDFSPSPYREKRYKDDVYDRLWLSLDSLNWRPLINTTATDENSIVKNNFKLPFTVMNSAYTPNISINYAVIRWTRSLPQNTEYYLYMHFAELVKLQSRQFREFDIYVNGGLWDGPIVPEYLRQTTIYKNSSISTDSDGNLTIWLKNTDASTLPPLINAFELYKAKKLLQHETNQIDVEAILNVKSTYGLKKNWQGDPCSPSAFLWDGLTCEYISSKDHLTIVSLNLSSSGLSGEIDPSIANLTNLQYLDLSSNNLSGAVPEFLSELKILSVLNLKGNNLEGPIQPALLERAKNGLSLSVDANVIGNATSSPPNNETSSSLTNGTSSATAHTLRKSKFLVPMVASVGVFLLQIAT